MISVKKTVLILTLISLIFPLSAFSSRKKVKEADKEHSEEFYEKRAEAEAEIAARKAAAELAENGQLEQERLEKEKLEREAAEAEAERQRLEQEELEQAAQKQRKEQELLQQQMEKELEKQKKATEKNRKEYLSDYMVHDIETIDDVASDEEEFYRIENPDERDISGRTQLMKAAKNGNEWELRNLLKSGASVNLTDDDGWTALMYAVRYNEALECIEIIMDAGADITIKNRYGSSALVLASCYNGNPQIITKLLNEYKSSDKEVLRSLVFLLSEQNISERQQLTILQLFMEKSVPLNVLYEGKTPLMYAAQYGSSTKVIQKLLDNQSSVTLRSTEGKTAFDYAMKNKNFVHDETYWALNKR